jgi:hypothetical protein
VKAINSPDVSSSNIFAVLFQTLRILLTTPLFIFGFNITKQIYSFGINVYLGVLCLLIIIVTGVKTKNTKLLLWSLFNIFVLYFMIEYKQPNIVEFTNNYLNSNIFYNTLPAFIMVIFIIKCVIDSFKKYWFPAKVVICILSVVLFNSFINTIDKPDYKFSDNVWEIEKCVNFHGDKIVNVGIHPYAPWSVKVPVSNLEKCIVGDKNE